MTLDFSALSARDAYAWLAGTIYPRPIAWTSTLSAAGVPNLAPFSFFQAVTPNPPTLLLVPLNNRDGSPKDTVRNLREVPEFVVHLVSHSLVESMNATSAAWPREVSEFAACGIASLPATRVRPPRVAEAPVAFECVVDHLHEVGAGPLAATVVFGRVLLAHVRDDLLADDGRPDPARLDLVGRMGGDLYATTRDRFALPRP